jgi:hypothetical protein
VLILRNGICDEHLFNRCASQLRTRVAREDAVRGKDVDASGFAYSGKELRRFDWKKNTCRRGLRARSELKKRQ